MILVFIFLGIAIALSLLFLMLILSTIKIKIEKLHIKSFNIDKKYIISLELYLLNKIKILYISIDDKKVNKIKQNDRFKNIKIKNIYKDLINPKEIIFASKKLNISIERLKLKLEIGSNNADTTAYLTGMVGGIIGIVLSNLVKNEVSKNIYYDVKPIYNEYVLNIDLDSIIKLKIVNIIIVVYFIYKLLKKGSGKNGGTSNRRSYVSSYEFN